MLSATKIERPEEASRGVYETERAGNAMFKR